MTSVEEETKVIPIPVSRIGEEEEEIIHNRTLEEQETEFISESRMEEVEIPQKPTLEEQETEVIRISAIEMEAPKTAVMDESETRPMTEGEGNDRINTNFEAESDGDRSLTQPPIDGLSHAHINPLQITSNNDAALELDGNSDKKQVDEEDLCKSVENDVSPLLSSKPFKLKQTRIHDWIELKNKSYRDNPSFKYDIPSWVDKFKDLFNYVQKGPLLKKKHLTFIFKCRHCISGSGLRIGSPNGFTCHLKKKHNLQYRRFIEANPQYRQRPKRKLQRKLRKIRQYVMQ